ncbi:hypothetical protein D3C76_1497950 [compost metagenome]
MVTPAGGIKGSCSTGSGMGTGDTAGGMPGMACPVMETLSKYRLPDGAFARNRSLLAGLLSARTSSVHFFCLLGSDAAPVAGLKSSRAVHVAPPS